MQKSISDSLTLIANMYASVGKVSVTNFTVDTKTKNITVNASDILSQIPFRPENVGRIYSALKGITGSKYPEYSITCITDTRNIEELIPEFFRIDSELLKNQKKPNNVFAPVVKNLSRPYAISSGLQNRHLAVWQSHGYYFNQKGNRWEWQRPRLFQTVEDLYTQSYVLPFLVPMLENAGANVFIPRERDTQLNEIIIDNDSKNKGGQYRELNDKKNWQTDKPGFGNIHKWWITGENPFQSGTFRMVSTTGIYDDCSYAEWIPEIPEEGYYAVYVSYKTVAKSCPDARYTVFHKGGITEFSVNQTMNGGTWLYLGHFRFGKGKSSNGKVVLSNFSAYNNRIVTSDAVKFGGGMGNIARQPQNINPITEKKQIIDSVESRVISEQTPKIYEAEISGYPRFTEGARYWLQWAGIPDSIYSRTKGTNDYSDDFQSRGFWVNYLTGGSWINPQYKGLGIPVDMAFAFHTDAGFSSNDSIVGTLGICTVQNTEEKTVFNNGDSRWTSRELTDIIQTQIVTDIREKYLPTWTRRGLWNKSYSESRVPEVPTMLLELLSHQNFADMRYGLDPRFRFTVSRAVYKGILKYLSFRSGQNYVVQPLPVSSFCSRFTDKNKVELSWKPVTETSEPTSSPKSYVVYTRIDNGGFNNGKVTQTNKITVDIQPGKIYSFKVSAINEGGQSFPSEILSVYRAINENGQVLIVNGFDRISAPESYKKNGDEGGFLFQKDAGVPWYNDISFTGKQTDFLRKSKFIDNNSPGFGASEKNYETEVIAGNSFDYPFLHGEAIKAANFSFVSCSLQSVSDGEINMNSYKFVDMITGKQKETTIGGNDSKTEFKTIPVDIQEKIGAYLLKGGNLLLSGAYLGSDIVENKFVSASEKVFLENILKIRYNGISSTNDNIINSQNNFFWGFKQSQLGIYNQPNRTSYYVESVDIIEPASAGAFTFCRYRTDNRSAGVAYSGNYKVCVLGFPFETIIQEKERIKLMYSILGFLSKKVSKPLSGN